MNPSYGKILASQSPRLLRAAVRISKLSSPDLRSAIEALLAGRPIRPAETKAFGCAIARR